MKPVIFTVVAQFDPDARLWFGRCDDVPVVAEAATLDDLLVKATEQTLDLLPDNHPGVDPRSVLVQLGARREAIAAVA